MQKTLIKTGFVTLIIIFFDQILKLTAQKYLVKPVIINALATLRYEENRGIAFGIAFTRPWLLFLNIVILACVIFFSFKFLDHTKKITLLTVSFVLGGGAGNLIDRLFRGYVIDYIAIGWWPVFNLADIFLSSGIFLIAVFYDKIGKSG